jgi:hypothetical protein
MPTDQLGNPLLLNDVVCLKVGDQMLVATVTEIKEPSILAPGKDQMVMPGQLNVVIPYTVMFDPRNPRCQGVVKIVKPLNFGKKEN